MPNLTESAIFYPFFPDNYIQKAKKNYTDSRTSRNLNQLNVELQDVQRIMVQNIDDVLQRGESLSSETNQYYLQQFTLTRCVSCYEFIFWNAHCIQLVI